jgi:YbgC/YbaW family acyl-CoA thioester hydrolase
VTPNAPSRPADPSAAPAESRVAVEARSYELDPYGHVNNSVFVNWLEHGRLCWLRDRGMTYTSIPETFGVHVVVVSLRLDYRAEVGLGDRLVVASDVVRLGNSSFAFAQRIEFDDGRVAAEGEVVMVCTRDGRSSPIPAELRVRLAPAAR